MLRRVILGLAHSPQVKDAVTTLPGGGRTVARYVAGESLDAAVEAVRRLSGDGLLVTIDHLGEDTTDEGRATATTEAYLRLLERLGAEELSQRAEVSVKLSAVGQALPAIGDRLALDNARRIAAAAREVGTTVTLDMEDHTTTDRTLATLAALRADFPETGAVLQAMLRRTEADCRALAYAGSRVRLCKGAYDEPVAVAYQHRQEVDEAYVRCMRILMSGEGYPMLATHDPRLIRIAAALAIRYHRSPDTYELQMLHGIRPIEQRRLAAQGLRMRVYVPYGTEWYGYLMRRLAERPANLTFFLRSLFSRK